MGCKECCGRYGLLVCAVVFCVGMLSSTLSASWIEVEHLHTDNVTSFVEFGPFYSQSRNCSTTTAENGQADEKEEICTEWVSNEISDEDCSFFGPIQDAETQDKLCRQHSTWRFLAMICMFIVVGTTILVAAATCTQCVTCGCCGGSIDLLASVAYWIEVALSIVCWSFCISVVMIIREVDFTDLVTSEVENISNVEAPEDLAEGNFLWGFWVFLFSGTFVGALCAIFADWASEGSLLRGLTDCIACTFGCKKK